MMQRKCEEEGLKQQLLFDKYMCYCQSSLRKLSAEIEVGKETEPQLESAIKEGDATKGGLQNDITDAKAEFNEAKKTLDEANALRKKENDEFKKEDGTMAVDIKALTKAVTAMDRLGE